MDNEYELLYLVKDGNEDAIEYLRKKYNNLLLYKAKKYSKLFSLDINDLLNECELSFYIATSNYQDKYKFSTYLNAIIDNSLVNYINSYNIKKNTILNEAISYDKSDNNLVQAKSDKYNPEKELFEEYDYNYIKSKIISNLTYREELVFNLKEQAYTPKEIADITDSSLRTIYNIINRIKNKTIKLMSN